MLSLDTNYLLLLLLNQNSQTKSSMYHCTKTRQSRLLKLLKKIFNVRNVRAYQYGH